MLSVVEAKSEGTQTDADPHTTPYLRVGAGLEGSATDMGAGRG